MYHQSNQNQPISNQSDEKVPSLKQLCIDSVLKHHRTTFFNSTKLSQDVIKLIQSENAEREAKATMEQLKDVSICKKMGLSGLKNLIDAHLNSEFVSFDTKKTFFLLLKKIEAEVLDITSNSLFRSADKQELKIQYEELQEYMKSKFGLASLFDSFTVPSIFGYNGFESRAKEFGKFLALELLLQDGSVPSSGKETTLEFVNSLFENGIISVEKGKQFKFEFSENKLKIIINNENKTGEYLEALEEIVGSRNLHEFQQLALSNAKEILKDLLSSQNIQSPKNSFTF